MIKNEIYLINAKVLPPIFSGVIATKRLIAEKNFNVSKAVKIAGISRSAFYKYKDYVFEYDEQNSNIINLSAVLSDKAGVFSALSTLLYELGANILTVNQSTPVDGTAKVNLTVRTDNIKLSAEELLQKLRSVNGILSVKQL